ncbi:MAG TPA: glycosyltransferase [Candidatus Thermoplasmatota archaeon]|nr:glycosyltransferase [Candidatus Thermoplasmatota archaeon]
MKQLRIGISTQTPLIRVGNEPYTLTPSAAVLGKRIHIKEGGFHVSAGGVSRLVLQTVRHWHATGWMREAHWFSLQPQGPERVRMDEYNLDIHHLRLGEEEMRAYARTKEKLWADLHGLEAERFDIEDFRFYARYNWSTGDAMMAQAPDLDALYVHDFQLLQVGAIIGLTAPAVLRWHVPFDPQRIPRYTRHFVLRLMEDFDGVVVSTRRDLQGLTNAGFRGKVLQEYPHTDLKDWPTPTPAGVQAFEELARLEPDTPVILCVGRMDPIKRQDVLVRAMASLRHQYPKARAVFIGNGAFSSLSGSGLGLGKADQWRAKLEALARELGVEANVTFTGWLSDTLVTAAYQRAAVLVLPSDIEGFGLTTFEAWAYRKPCVISSGCGSAEVVQDGVNGYTFPPQDHEALAARLEALLGNREMAERMGEAGNVALAAYTVQQSAPRVATFIEEAIERSRRA